MNLSSMIDRTSSSNLVHDMIMMYQMSLAGAKAVLNACGGSDKLSLSIYRYNYRSVPMSPDD